MNKTQVVTFVLGMHRSGTSAMAGALQLLGIDLGDDLMKEKKDNVKGFFEHNEVVQINDEILSTFNRRWDSLLGLPEGWESSMASHHFQKKIQHFFYRQFADIGQIGIKDPRLSVTLPIWQKVLETMGIAHQYIIMLRHPMEVSKSLQKRNFMSEENSLLMWVQHSLHIELLTQRFPRVFVHFDDLLTKPINQIDQIASQLGMNFPKAPPTSEAEILDFLSPSLKHHKITPNTSIASQVPLLEEIRQSIWELSRTDQQSSARENLAALRKQWHQHVSLFHPIELWDIFQKFDEQQKELHKKEEALEKKEKEIDILQNEKEQQYGEINSLLRLKAQAQAQLDWQIHESAHAQLEVSYLKEHLNQQKIEVQAIKDSLSYRLGRFATAPARWLYNTFFTRLAILGRLFSLFLKHPIKSLKQFRLSNIKTLRKALLSEESDKIIKNFREHIDPTPTEQANAPGSISPASDKQTFSDQKKQELTVFLEQGGRFSFEPQPSPQVSILLVLYNRAELTFACLKSLQKVSAPFELIIIDNASQDATHQLLQSIDNAQIVKNEENEGFLKACNQASALARGKYLLFLNNDAQLLPGSLEAAISTLENTPQTGVVGGKICLLDGTLQEAGNIIWQDGSCLGYGRGQNPEKPEFMFRRTVDYVSGVFLLTPKSLFEELGGFDTRFAPAYYEETDYCMRVWQSGYEVMYEPEGQVIHFEFGSAENSSQAIALQQAHQEIFVTKHATSLDKHYPPEEANILLARETAKISRKRILFIEDMIPHVDEGAGFPRANQILWHLHEMGYFISILPINFPYREQWDTAYRDLPREIELLLGKGKADLPYLLRERAGYYDFLWISRPHSFEYFLSIHLQIKPFLAETKIIYDAEAIFSNRDIAFAKLQNNQQKISAYEAQLQKELQLAQHADAVIAVNPAEASQFENAVRTPVFGLDAAFELDATTTPFSQREGLLFVGNMDHDLSPNVDSIEWLIQEVYPHLAARIGTPELTLIGSKKSSKIQQLANRYPFVKLYGRVPQLKSLFEKNKVFVVPTRYAAGSPAKVLQAAALGIPIVCTDFIQAQLGWGVEKAILSASHGDPQLFAEQICRVYESEDLSQQIVEGAYRELETRFSHAKQRDVLEKILHQPSPSTTHT